jgi:hypothetical protein
MRLQISSSANLSCSSDLNVRNMQWLNNGQVLLNSTGQQRLFLPIEMVTSFLINKTYTCEVQVMLATVIRDLQMNITLQINSKYD